MEIYVKNSFISIFSPFFLVIKHDFIRCVDFTCIAASNTASDDVRTFNTDLLIILCSFCSRN